jgi:predicted polyphosphate/ATP-dependent NAD kinase
MEVIHKKDWNLRYSALASQVQYLQGVVAMGFNKLGLIVNPVSGLGGRVGLKGSDGEEIQARAKVLGARPIAQARAVETLNRLATFKSRIELLTYPYSMGEEEARECGLEPTVIGSISREKTTAADTKKAATEMKSRVDLLLFVGGDGTARDVYEAVKYEVPVLGIPSGVKMHSSVFAVNPQRAAQLVMKFLKGEVVFRNAEVLDIDEAAFREKRVSARLYAYLRIPYERDLVQQAKSGSPSVLDERICQEAIAEYIIERMDNNYYYILGPGTTVKAIADRLGIKKTLLGVDAINRGKIVAMDLDENQLLNLIEGKKVKIIVTPIGGQGYIFGRGNQQISSEVIRKVGKENIIVIATKNKLLSIGIGQPLLVDTGDLEVDETLSRYTRVVAGYNEEIVAKVTT